jgi:Ca2+-binding EF-hand superfamily protein
MKVYSAKQSEEYLTVPEFVELAQDLYDTLDNRKKLTEKELNNLINLIDLSKNHKIERDELIQIVQSNFDLHKKPKHSA